MAERFIDAAKDGHIDLLRNATKRDLNTPDEDGMTATLWAARVGKLEALRLIVSRQGDVNHCDYLGLSALHHAALEGHIDIVTFLTNWGCNLYALDNDLHSALDLAAIRGQDNIVKYLDQILAQKQAENPKQVMRLREEAMKAAEANIKRYEKLQEAAARRAEKEKKRLEREIEQQQHLNGNGHINGISSESKKNSFFKTLTMRIKGGNAEKAFKGTATKFSDMTGFSQTSGPRSGIAKKIQMKRLETLTPKSEFTISNVDEQGNRTRRNLTAGEALRGSQPEVMYLTAQRIGGDASDFGMSRRPMLNDAFNRTNIYKAKSESDLLDSGVDSNNGDDEDDLGPEIFHRPGFGQLTVFSNNSFLNTMHSFNDPEYTSEKVFTDGSEILKRISGDGEEMLETNSEMNGKQPWDLDDLGNLDDDDELNTNEYSAVEMFLWTCGLANYFPVFKKEEIDIKLLMNITDEELQELGLPLGPRKRLKDAIARRKSVLAMPFKMVATKL